LMKRKNEIESEIASFQQILAANNVGMNEPLVDSEGYPRNDLDIFQVRTARNKIICLQNDHKGIMSQIENGLHRLHEQTRNAEPTNGSKSTDDREMEAFVLIKSIQKGAPCDRGGFKVNDQICLFGSLQKSNFRELSDMVSIISNSVNKEIDVIVRRGSTLLNLKLTPSKWVGNGLVGWKVDKIDK